VKLTLLQYPITSKMLLWFLYCGTRFLSRPDKNDVRVYIHRQLLSSVMQQYELSTHSIINNRDRSV